MYPPMSPEFIVQIWQTMKLCSLEICWTASRPISPYPSRKTLSIGWLPSYDDLGDFKKDLWDRSRFPLADESWEELESAVVRKWQGWWDFEIRAALRSNLDTEYCHKIASSLSQNWLIRSTKERVCALCTWTFSIWIWWMENVSKSHKQLPLAQTAPSTKRNRQLGSFPTKAAGHACRTQLGQIKAYVQYHTFIYIQSMLAGSQLWILEINLDWGDIYMWCNPH